jgi:hypothetical protein
MPPVIGVPLKNQVFATPAHRNGPLEIRPLVLEDLPAGIGTVIQIVQGDGIICTPNPINSSGMISLATSGVTPGSYTNANITVDAYGRITLASNGSSGGVTSIATTAPITGGTITTTGTIGITQSSGSTDGYLSAIDWTTFNNKMANPMTTLGDIIYGSTSGTPTRLAGNITSRLKFLSQTGTGTASAAPTWELLPLTGSVTYYLLNSNSDIATYKNQEVDSLGATTTFTTGSIGTGTALLRSWATLTGVPNLSVIPSGLFMVHIHADQSAGTKLCTLYGEIWECNSLGVDIGIIGTTVASPSLTSTTTAYSLTFSTTTAYALASTSSRIVTKIYVVGATGGSSGTVNLYYGSTTYDSSTYIPAGTVDVSTFVPYIGATNDVNLGANDITATKLITNGGTSSDFVKGDGTLDNTTYTPTSRTLTINGVGYDLSANRSWTVSGTPAGSTSQVQYNNAGSFDGAANVQIDTTDENLLLLATSSTTAVSAPGSSNRLKIWGNSRVGTEQPFITPFLGPEYPLQASLGYKITGGYTVSGSTNIFAWGQLASAMSAVNPGNGGATITARTYDATNLLPNYARYGLVTATTASSYAEQRTSITGKGSVMGNAAYGGGSKLVYTFGLGAYNSAQRLFFGYTGSTLTWSGNTDPSAQINTFGLGKDVGDTTFQWMENDGSGTATKTNTGITPNTNDVYRLTIFIPSNATTVYMQLEVMTKSSITLYTRSASSDIPATGTLMYQRMYVNNAATGAAVSIMMIQIEEELY